jgi:hypothetical protein
MSTPTRIWNTFWKAVSYGPGANLKIAELTAQNDNLREALVELSERIGELEKKLIQAEALHHVQLKKIAELEDDNERLMNERDAAYREQTDLYQQLQSAKDEPGGVDDNPYAGPGSVRLRHAPYAELLTFQDLKSFVGSNIDCKTRVSFADRDSIVRTAPALIGEWGKAILEGLMPSIGLKIGKMILLDADGNELRRHNPGDPMPWRDK